MLHPPKIEAVFWGAVSEEEGVVGSSLMIAFHRILSVLHRLIFISLSLPSFAL